MQQQQKSSFARALVALALAILVIAAATGSSEARPDGKASHFIQRRSHDSPKSMMHNHLSRKVFDRACAASKDSIDEIVACLTGSEILVKTIKEDTAKNCYKDAFGSDFDPKEVTKHKELICNNRDKFESMTTCIYKKTSELMNPKELDKFTESLVDVGLCIINALDG